MPNACLHGTQMKSCLHLSFKLPKKLMIKKLISACQSNPTELQPDLKWPSHSLHISIADGTERVAPPASLPSGTQQHRSERDLPVIKAFVHSLLTSFTANSPSWMNGNNDDRHSVSFAPLSGDIARTRVAICPSRIVASKSGDS